MGLCSMTGRGRGGVFVGSSHFGKLLGEGKTTMLECFGDAARMLGLMVLVVLLLLVLVLVMLVMLAMLFVGSDAGDVTGAGTAGDAGDASDAGDVGSVWKLGTRGYNELTGRGFSAFGRWQRF